MKANVLEIVGSFHQGGSERQAIQLARLLREEGSFNVFLATLDGAGILGEEVEAIGFGSVPEFNLTSFYDFNMLRQVKKAARFMRENDIKIVHTHDFYTNVFGMLSAKFAGVPVRIASKRETGGVKTPNQTKLERQAFRLAHSIVANASAVRNYLIEHGVSGSKIEVVYNGLDLKRLQPKSNLTRRETCEMFDLPVERNRKFVTIVANLRHAVKNQEMFLRAAQKVRARIKNAKFVLAGEGERLGELKNLAAELGIGEACHFTGRCAAVAELLSISDVCVLSSTNEGFSNSILEYMAAGKPVVATNVGGAGEAIVEGETGFLIASDDAETMAARLVELLEDDEKARRFGAEARKIIEEKFSSEAQVDKTVTLYETLLYRRSVGEEKTTARTV
ncbi:MAG TPA: glycosyltransferase [Pyrinomonadaceae bacterium]|nr:glycosyltransferase [Pyrinomonadaceae bacterium]